MTLSGRHYAAGEVVPSEVLSSLDARLVGKLVDQRRIIPAPKSVTEPEPKPKSTAKKRKASKRKIATARR